MRLADYGWRRKMVSARSHITAMSFSDLLPQYIDVYLGIDILLAS